MPLFIALFLLLLLSPNVFAWQTLTLGYPEFRPYTYTEDQLAKGLGVQWLDKVKKQLHLDIHFQPVSNYGLGVQLLKRGKIDGLFLATENSERNQVAIFSEPVTFNRWVWFYLKENKPDLHSDRAKQVLKVVSHENANTHKWLLANGYQSVYPTHDVKAMIRQLFHQRVDAVFLAEQVFLSELAKSPWPLNSVSRTVEMAQPFGIYIARRYLRQHPGFMTQLNRQIILMKKQESAL